MNKKIVFGVIIGILVIIATGAVIMYTSCNPCINMAYIEKKSGLSFPHDAELEVTDQLRRCFDATITMHKSDATSLKNQLTEENRWKKLDSFEFFKIWEKYEGIHEGFYEKKVPAKRGFGVNSTHLLFLLNEDIEKVDVLIRYTGE